ncbi:MAG: DUF4199 domain-containing protein [Gammaproteobacteria bacterium]|nr:DUF4199 domain-containing protein [Gammaproteobacteria bacterium]MYF37241.1 DUF4199 domain-containing protein [Gammaproteobacteria bacterium]
MPDNNSLSATSRAFNRHFDELSILCTLCTTTISLMFRSVLLLGLVAGVAVAALTLLVTTVGDPTLPTLFSQVVKNLTMATVLFMCLFGIKRVRDRTPGGTISLPEAIVVGFGICALASLIHCAAWELYYFSTDYQFARENSQNLMQRAQLAGASAIEIAELMERNGKIVEAFANPFLRITTTYLQMFVIGAVVSLVGAVLIRNPKFLPTRRKEDNED